MRPKLGRISIRFFGLEKNEKTCHKPATLDIRGFSGLS